jgi:hypothetical protein
MLARQSEMRAREPNAILAYWVVPAEPARNFFASTIAELASRFDAPLFEPHVTVYVTRKGDENPEDVLSSALADCEPLRLSVRDIQCSDEFTKTVLVQFEPSPSLLRLCGALQQASGSHDEYQLDPHVSLIYKKMTQDARIDVATSVRLPFTEVLFDSVKAVVCPTPIRSREDVEAWCVVAAQTLTE